MVIAILYALGISAGGILLLLIALLLLKRYKIINDPRVFEARIRLADGTFPGLTDTWKRCRAAWVTTVLTTRTGLPLNIADVVPVQGLEGARDAVAADDLRGLGDTRVIASFTMTTGATVEVAVAAQDRSVALAPWSSAEAPGR
jgi:hypothetical protein